MWYSGKKHHGELDEAKRLYEYEMRKQEVVEFKYKLVHAAAPQADATLNWSKLDDNRQHVGGGIETENTSSDVRGKAKIDKRGAKHKADRLQKRMSEKRKALPSALPKLTPPIVAYLKTAFTEYDQDHNGNLDVRCCSVCAPSRRLTPLFRASRTVGGVLDVDLRARVRFG